MGGVWIRHKKGHFGEILEHAQSRSPVDVLHVIRQGQHVVMWPRAAIIGATYYYLDMTTTIIIVLSLIHI